MEMNKYMLMVMAELKNDPYFFKPNSILCYTIPRDSEKLDTKTFGGKVAAVLDLNSLGAITIYNKGEERIPGTTTYEFQILVPHPLSFDGIYKRCIKEVTGQNLEEFENQIQTKKNMPAQLKKLNQCITINKIIGKQARFLELLSNFEPHLIEDLEKDVPTEDIKDLKKRVKKKIEESGFFIETVRSKSSYKRGTYRLSNSPPTGS